MQTSGQRNSIPFTRSILTFTLDQKPGAGHMLSMFLRMLKKRKDKDEKPEEAIAIIENGFDGVKEENLLPVLEWLNAR